MNDTALLDDDPVVFKGGTLRIVDYDDSEGSPQHGSSSEKSQLLIPWSGEDYKSYFSSRDGLVKNAISEIQQMYCKNDELIGAWLLTEITFWDNEKERIVLVTRNDLFVVKYDLIGLKLLDHYKVPLRDIDTLLIGDLVYPTGSVAPHLIGITSGLSHMLKTSRLKFLHGIFGHNTSEPNIPDIFDISSFKPRSRNMIGIRPLWNKGEPIRFSTKWNPFSNNIPWSTFTSHPLLWHKGGTEDDQKIYNVENFATHLIKAAQQTDRVTMCNVQHQPILLQNYFGFLSVLHNRSNLGFFKVRGKFSF